MVRATEDEATGHAWAALGGAADLLGNATYGGRRDGLPARLPVHRLARAAVGVCSLAAAELLARRRGAPVPAVAVDEGAVAAAFTSERLLRIDGRRPTTFAPLSGFWPAADGWVRTHANYPHHRARLLAALGIPDDGSGDAAHLVPRLRQALAERPADEIQETAYAAGALAVAVAPAPTAQAPGRTAGLPLVETRPVGDAPGRPLPDAPLPAAGVRVLDLTRVIAGPVATRTLGLLGADVLRVDAPQLPESADAHADTGFGKRSTRLDLTDPGDRATAERLVDAADVVVTGYRPGALDRFGLSPRALLERRPDLVVAQLCAWGWDGPWTGRRGFDSLVQAGSGIAAVEAAPDGRPGALPAQALDHGTGYLLAAAVLRALTERRAHGGGRHIRLSLAGTASWLLHGIPPQPPTEAAADGEPDPEEWTTTTVSPAYGPLRHARPPIAYAGAPADWTRPPGAWGTDTPTWL